MKKLLLGSIFTITMAFLFFQSSCSKKDENGNPNTSAYEPKIEITSHDTSLPVQCYESQEILISLVAESNPTSGKALSSLKISFKFENEAEVTLLDSVISGNQFILYDYPLPAYWSAGEEIWTFRVADTDGQYSETHFKFVISDSPSPIIALLSGTYQPLNIPYTDGDVTLEVGSQFVFGITASSQSDKDLRRIFIQRVYENVSSVIILDSTFSSATFTLDIITFAYPVLGTEDFTITVWDKNDKSSSIGFTITTVLGDPEMSIYTDIVLGSYNLTDPNSCFASLTGETFSIDEAANNSEKIDWIYFDGQTYGNIIIAPDDDIVLSIYASVENWTTRNSTKFTRTNITSAVFDGIMDRNSLIASLSPYLVNLNNSYISELMPLPGDGFDVGDVYGFKTGGQELLGLIKITEVNQGANNGLSTIKYDIKIQD